MSSLSPRFLGFSWILLMVPTVVCQIYLNSPFTSSFLPLTSPCRMELMEKVSCTVAYGKGNVISTTPDMFVLAFVCNGSASGLIRKPYTVNVRATSSSHCTETWFDNTWRLEEIASVAESRLHCGSRCTQTPGCRGFSIDAPLCRLLRVTEPDGGLTGCGSRANIPGTTYIVTFSHDMRNVSRLTQLHPIRPTGIKWTPHYRRQINSSTPNK